MEGLELDSWLEWWTRWRAAHSFVEYMMYHVLYADQASCFGGSFVPFVKCVLFFFNFISCSYLNESTAKVSSKHRNERK